MEYIKENIKDFNTNHIFDCGQCFRWEKDDDGSYTGTAKGKIARISLRDDLLTIDNCDENDFQEVWREYLDLDTDYSRIKEYLTQNDDDIKEAVSYGYGGTGNDYDFRYYYSNWDVSYAEDMFYRGHGDCFAFASAFAYLANAVGFEAKVISSGGHGWAEIKGAVCDPNWAKGTGNIERYYRMSYDLSGVDGRPYYKGNRAYVITI